MTAQSRHPLLLALCAVGVAAMLAGCKREERQYRPMPPAAALDKTIRMSPIQPGQPNAEPKETKNDKEESAYAVAEGQRLFQSYNCNGCHANGGGGMGPPLMDNKWIYGSDPANIVATILEGRPNGMPSFRDKIPEDQVWELAAYVRSMSGLLPKDVSPSRQDHMSAKTPESSTQAMTPAQGGSPPPASTGTRQ
jgi:cytochrome c oxidase cbb3-type subunit III